MTRQTQKYLAARNQARALALRLPSQIANDKLYERLEGEGFWWNGDTWTNEPRSRSRRIDIDGSGANPDLIEFRVTAQADKLLYITEALRKMGEALGWTFVQQSDGYENRNQAPLGDANKRIRVYSSFIMPDLPGFSGFINEEGEFVPDSEAQS